MIDNGFFFSFQTRPRSIIRNPTTSEYATVMEYADLGTLHDLWDLKESTNMPLRIQIRMALQIAQALQHVRKKNGIHRGNFCLYLFYKISDSCI